MIELNIIKPPVRGNDKLGPVLTESRETGPTCPNSCPLKHGACYSHKLGLHRTCIAHGMAARDAARIANRSAWVRSRVKAWRKEAGRPVRFLVHGDMVDPSDNARLDMAWAVDVLRAARQVKGFCGWGYTHAWRYPGARRVRDLFKRAGITLWASVHNYEEAWQANMRGWNVARISETLKHGYTGPRAHVPADLTRRPAIVCPEQIGTKADCLTCGFCYQAAPRCDLVLLKH